MTKAFEKMTNVKLKLMFFLLNALLSADLVHSRPYSDFNSTDIIMSISNNSSPFNIPVDPNSDTLIVANEDETQEEINKNSNTNLEAIVNAEQDRDKVLADNKNQDQISILEIPNNEAKAFEKQFNISSPLLEEMIDSESDREDTLTDILFRHDSEFVEDTPRFEFLIAAKINGSDVNDTVNDMSVSNSNMDKRERNNSDVLRKVDYVELVEVIKPSNTNENKSAYNLANITAHNIDNDVAPDTRFSDVQTLFTACFATILPMFVLLFAILAIRRMVRRWCPRCCKRQPDSTNSVSSDKQENNHQQLKSSEDGDTDGETPPANGSIFTMTLKNNHLIVETEERNDITKNGRETKMKYSPDNDGIFVVEVQQSASYRPNKMVQTSPRHDPQISTNQALIHRVPEELDKKIIEEDSERSSGKFEKQALALSSTGLSISDLSMSSIGSHNVSYSYSSQMGYDQGPFGYPVYVGYDTSKDDIGEAIIHDNSQEPLIGKTPTDPDRPVVTAAIFKQDSIISNDVLKGPGYCIEGSTDGPLLSDVQAREYSLQQLHDQKEKKLENGVAIPIADKIDSVKCFSRADSLPVTLENETEVGVMETIAEDLPSKENFKGKRASLPVITADAYSVKDVQTGSPGFINEMSQGESSFDSPPMITITEESESGKSDSTS